MNVGSHERREEVVQHLLHRVGRPRRPETSPGERSSRRGRRRGRRRCGPRGPAPAPAPVRSTVPGRSVAGTCAPARRPMVRLACESSSRVSPRSRTSWTSSSRSRAARWVSSRRISGVPLPMSPSVRMIIPVRYPRRFIFSRNAPVPISASSGCGTKSQEVQRLLHGASSLIPPPSHDTGLETSGPASLGSSRLRAQRCWRSAGPLPSWHGRHGANRRED